MLINREWPETIKKIILSSAFFKFLLLKTKLLNMPENAEEESKICKFRHEISKINNESIKKGTETMKSLEKMK
jgi:hypothetical protein